KCSCNFIHQLRLLSANTLDNRRNCRHNHMLDDYTDTQSNPKRSETVQTSKTRMKQMISAAILGASVTLAASLFLSPLLSHQVKAAVAGGGEQYKIVETGKYSSVQQLEQQLNTLGVDGWKARTAVGSLLVLAK